MKKYTLEQLKENYQAWTKAVIVLKQKQSCDSACSIEVVNHNDLIYLNSNDNFLFSCLTGIDEIDYCYITESHGYKLGDKVKVIHDLRLQNNIGDNDSFTNKSILLDTDDIFTIESLSFDTAQYYKDYYRIGIRYCDLKKCNFLQDTKFTDVEDNYA